VATFVEQTVVEEVAEISMFAAYLGKGAYT